LILENERFGCFEMHHQGGLILIFLRLDFCLVLNLLVQIRLDAQLEVVKVESVLGGHVVKTCEDLLHPSLDLPLHHLLVKYLCDIGLLVPGPRCCGDGKGFDDRGSEGEGVGHVGIDEANLPWRTGSELTIVLMCWAMLMLDFHSTHPLSLTFQDDASQACLVEEFSVVLAAWAVAVIFFTVMISAVAGTFPKRHFL
jgi:hypothetical protein